MKITIEYKRGELAEAVIIGKLITKYHPLKNIVLKSKVFRKRK